MRRTTLFLLLLAVSVCMCSGAPGKTAWTPAIQTEIDQGRLKIIQSENCVTTGGFWAGNWEKRMTDPKNGNKPFPQFMNYTCGAKGWSRRNKSNLTLDAGWGQGYDGFYYIYCPYHTCTKQEPGFPCFPGNMCEGADTRHCPTRMIDKQGNGDMDNPWSKNPTDLDGMKGWSQCYLDPDAWSYYGYMDLRPFNYVCMRAANPYYWDAKSGSVRIMLDHPGPYGYADGIPKTASGPQFNKEGPLVGEVQIRGTYKFPNDGQWNGSPVEYGCWRTFCAKLNKDVIKKEWDQCNKTKKNCKRKVYLQFHNNKLDGADWEIDLFSLNYWILSAKDPELLKLRQPISGKCPTKPKNVIV